MVVEGSEPNLLGRSWLKELAKADQLVCKVESGSILKLKEVLEKHSAVFKERLGKLKGTTVKIYVDREAQS